ncbi:nucleoside diphosphate-linked moiety X motif 17 [Eurytemora carolleeae]|uniref:nucleoside diphosphate-linked moiety X motif 17 n=1 Tax=Eurytemora carolleeae TaxID=1294199 RepID=UPI000C77FB6A|nr:nucleoside diphosphate-linked moiety X motif 17 [Eurytemora carolleeae]|eukprot:XP_023345985.1 nucleoside diphosphate-linked moiety X motif 17-like [Eurytemora affinis]
MALVGQIRKVLVHVQGRGVPLLVNFTECLLGASSDSCRTNSLDVQHFSLCACRSGLPALGRSVSPSSVSGCPYCEYFSCKLENNILILHKSDKESGVVLSHPPFCPILHLTQEDIAVLPADIAGRGVDVGVVGLLQSVDGRILLTRRADHMRSFPRTWVPPGGHVELGESLEAAVSREMFEETGLNTEGCTVQLLCMWESVYPYILSMGQPTRHHLVLYYLVRYIPTQHLVRDIPISYYLPV